MPNLAAAQDNQWMAQALALARAAGTLPAPNPAVGCLLVSPEGAVIGRGHTQAVGGPHAERVALVDALTRGHTTQGATAYVTLEPCSHQGRTGPCCEALIAAGVRRVVAAMVDPNPLVAGAGLARLRAAGITVESGLGAVEAAQINLGFFSRMLRKTPWVRMKIAASLDGKTALDNGLSQWITGPDARADGHAWRARADVVLTGIGTVLEDDPSLDVRLSPTLRQPSLVVIDSRLQLPLTARLLLPKRDLLVFYAVDGAAQRHKKAVLEKLGATVVCLPGSGSHGGEHSGEHSDKVDLAAVMHALARQEVNEVHVEAGYKLNGSLWRAGLVDELLVYLAPQWIGPGRGMAELNPLNQLDQAKRLEFVSTDMVGPDLRIVARPIGRSGFVDTALGAAQHQT